MINQNLEKNLRNPQKRDIYARFFSYEHILFSSLTAEEFDAISAFVLGTENLERHPDSHISAAELENLDENMTRWYVRLKRFNMTNTFYHYSRVYDLCRVLGVANVYDLGCCTLNQGLMLTRYSNLRYVGIEGYRFYLNDYRISDFYNRIGVSENPAFRPMNFYYPTVDTAPPAFCDGRISYIKAEYPCELHPPVNSMGVSMRSLLFLDSREKIEKAVHAMTTDFDRIVFDVPHNRIDEWKNAGWEGFEMYEIGAGYMLATKYPGDLAKLKLMYPCENGVFHTGIGAFESYNSPFESEEKFETERAVHWNE